MLEPVSLDGFSEDRPPAVVLGDLSLVRSLGMAKIPVLLATADPSDCTLRSRYVRGGVLVAGFGREERDATARALVSLGARLFGELGRKVPLVYGSDQHLELIYRHRRELQEYYLFTVHDEPLAEALHDKERFYEVAALAGLRVPSTHGPGPVTEGSLAALREPLIVKPKKKADWAELQRRLFDGKGKARVFATRRDLLGHPEFERFEDDLIVQEHIPGGVESLPSFHAFADAQGRILADFCGRKIRTTPDWGGESAVIELTNDMEVREEGAGIAAKLGLKGPFKIDLIRDPRTGKLFVLEINARYNLWHYLGAVHGVNLPAVAYEYQVYGHRPRVSVEISPTYRWVDAYRDYLAFRELSAKGALSLSSWLGSLLSPRNVFETFAWSDPAPMSQWTKDFLRRRLSRGALRSRV